MPPPRAPWLPGSPRGPTVRAKEAIAPSSPRASKHAITASHQKGEGAMLRAPAAPPPNYSSRLALMHRGAAAQKAQKDEVDASNAAWRQHADASRSPRCATAEPRAARQKEPETSPHRAWLLQAQVNQAASRLEALLAQSGGEAAVRSYYRPAWSSTRSVITRS